MNLTHLRRFWPAGVVLAAVLALLPFSFHAERHLETATRIEGSEAGKFPEELATRFHSPFVDTVVLVMQGLPAADSQEGRSFWEGAAELLFSSGSPPPTGPWSCLSQGFTSCKTPCKTNCGAATRR